MKYAFAAIALAAVARAQTLGDIPSCALPCITDAVSSETSCSTDDFTCICQDDNFSAIQGTATSCVISKCGADVALNDVLPATEALCSAQGSGAASTTAAAETTSAAAETSAAETTVAETTVADTTVAETTAVVTTTASSVVATTSTFVTTVAPTTVAPTTMAAPTNATMPASTVVPTGAAAAVGPLGGFALLGLAALAL